MTRDGFRMFGIKYKLWVCYFFVFWIDVIIVLCAFLSISVYMFLVLIPINRFCHLFTFFLFLFIYIVKFTGIWQKSNLNIVTFSQCLFKMWNTTLFYILGKSNEFKNDVIWILWYSWTWVKFVFSYIRVQFYTSFIINMITFVHCRKLHKIMLKLLKLIEKLKQIVGGRKVAISLIKLCSLQKLNQCSY